LSKISDFHHSKLILLSKTQKGHFNSIKSAKGKIKKDIWRQYQRQNKGKVNQRVKGDKIHVIGI
jgi:hypothetical protein